MVHGDTRGFILFTCERARDKVRLYVTHSHAYILLFGLQTFSQTTVMKIFFIQIFCYILDLLLLLADLQ